MYGVCPHCRIDHPIEISTEKDMEVEYVESNCIVCGSTFAIHKHRITCPHCNGEVFPVPRVITVEKSRLIYENQPIDIRENMIR